MFRLNDVLLSGDFGDWNTPAPKGLQALDERFGKAWRVAAIPLTALVLGMFALCMLALAQALTKLI